MTVISGHNNPGTTSIASNVKYILPAILLAKDIFGSFTSRRSSYRLVILKLLKIVHYIYAVLIYHAE